VFDRRVCGEAKEDTRCSARVLVKRPLPRFVGLLAELVSRLLSRSAVALAFGGCSRVRRLLVNSALPVSSSDLPACSSNLPVCSSALPVCSSALPVFGYPVVQTHLRANSN